MPLAADGETRAYAGAVPDRVVIVRHGRTTYNERRRVNGDPSVDVRLSAAGMGATKPCEPNDTPQGRAQNRRVELVKM